MRMVAIFAGTMTYKPATQAEILDLEPLTAETWLDNLDQMEAAFVVAYVESLDVKNSALKAGYSKSVAMSYAYTWLSKEQCTKPHVRLAVNFALEQRRNEQLVSKDLVIRRLKTIAFSDIRSVVRWRAHKIVDADEDSEAVDGVVTVREIVSNTIEVRDWDQLTDDEAAAIKSIKQAADGSITVEMHNPAPALRELARHLGIGAPRRLNLAVTLQEGRRHADDANHAKRAADDWQNMLEGPDSEDEPSVDGGA